MTLEVIQQAWQHHASPDNEADPCGSAQDDAHSGFNDRLVIASQGIDRQAFLSAFTDLAEVKHGRSSDAAIACDGSLDRLLLRDILENLDPSPFTGAKHDYRMRYGACAHMLREDVCSFLLEHRDFAASLFSACLEGKQMTETLSSPRSKAEWWTAAGSSSSGVNWTDLLALAMGLRLIPRLVDISTLKTIIDQVSSAPHRAQNRNDLSGGVLGYLGHDRNDGAHANISLSYPEFVEVLSLLATAAADQLRDLYPDIVEAENDPYSYGAGDTRRKNLGGMEEETAATTCRSQSPPFASEGTPATLCESKDQISCRRKAAGLADKQDGEGRSLNALHRAIGAGSDAHAADELVAGLKTQDISTYDLWPMKALFHHAYLVRKEAESFARDRTRADAVAYLRGRGWNVGPARDANKTSHRGGRSFSGFVGRDTRIRDDVEDALDFEGPACDRARVSPSKSGSPLASSMPSIDIFDAIDDRMGELATEMRIRGVGDDGMGSLAAALSCTLPHEVGKTWQRSVCPTQAAVARGQSAKLVIIKELHPVPEDAPASARCLLEIALDHQQSGRYDMALNILGQARGAWETSINGNRDLRSRSGNKGRSPSSRSRQQSKPSASENNACTLHPADESAGADDLACSRLLKADRVILAMHEKESSLQQSLRAVILGELGVTAFYCKRAGLALRCFRLALLLRCDLLRSSLRKYDHEKLTASSLDHCGPVDDKSSIPQTPSKTRAEDVAGVGGSPADGAATAITLNNIGVSFAGIGQKGKAVRALTIALHTTTSLLGVEHPRSVAMSRNLSRLRVDGEVLPHRLPLRQREERAWASLDSWMRDTCLPIDNGDEYVRDGGRIARSCIIPGGFIFTGILSRNDGRSLVRRGKVKKGRGGSTSKGRVKAARRRNQG